MLQSSYHISLYFYAYIYMFILYYTRLRHVETNFSKKVRYHLVDTRRISWLCRYQSWKAGIGGGFEAKVQSTWLRCFCMFLQTSKNSWDLVHESFLWVHEFIQSRSGWRSIRVNEHSRLIIEHFTWLQTLLDLDVLHCQINVTKTSLDKWSSWRLVHLEFFEKKPI